jgi:hypothetical protein
VRVNRCQTFRADGRQSIQCPCPGSIESTGPPSTHTEHHDNDPYRGHWFERRRKGGASALPRAITDQWSSRAGFAQFWAGGRAVRAAQPPTNGKKSFEEILHQMATTSGQAQVAQEAVCVRCVCVHTQVRRSDSITSQGLIGCMFHLTQRQAPPPKSLSLAPPPNLTLEPHGKKQEEEPPQVHNCTTTPRANALLLA